MEAVKRNWPCAVFALLSSVSRKYRERALVIATACGRKKVVSILLKAGVDVSCRDNQPVRIAVMKENIPILIKLVHYGGDVPRRNTQPLAKHFKAIQEKLDSLP